MVAIEGNGILKEWYLYEIEQSKRYITLSQQWISTLNGIRERYQGNWRIMEACREIIFYHMKEIQKETEEIGSLRRAIGQLG